MALIELEAERAVLSAVILDARQAGMVDELDPDLFGDARHRLIFEAMVCLRQRETPIDLLTLQTELDAAGKLEKVGGMAYLAALDLDLPALAHLPAYLETLRDRWLRRETQAACTKAAARIAKSARPAPELVRRLRDDLMSLEHGATQNGFATWPAVVDEGVEMVTQRKGGEAVGIPTGFRDLDRDLRGLRPGNNIVIGGRTGDGKTALALNIAWHVAHEQRKPAAYFSLEMGSEELFLRILSSHTRIPSHDIDKGYLNAQQRAAVERARDTLRSTPFFVTDSGNLTVQEVVSLSRRAKDTTGLAVVVVDYIQLVGNDREFERRDLEVAHVSRTLKQLARELNVTVIALSQFNRAGAKGNDAPTAYDFRESGAIEQDADIAIAMHRPNKEDRVVELHVVKFRNGPRGLRPRLFFRESCLRFEDWTQR
jgi:replicative DNA helicase